MTEREQTPIRPKMSLRGRMKRQFRRLVIWTLVLGVLFGAILLFKDRIVDLLRRNATVWAIYSHIAGQIHHDTLLGLFYAGFFGALFFIMIPLEAVFLYYLSLHYPGLLVVVVMWVGSLLGLTADYIMGAVAGERLLARFSPQKFIKTKAAMDRWGGLIVVVSNIVPFLPVQFISLGIGATRYGLKSFFIYTAASRFAYLMTLWLSADYFRQAVLPYIS